MADHTLPELTDLTIFITKRGDDLVTDSRAVAITFKKKHKSVLRVIEQNLFSANHEIAEFARANFELCSYDDRGRAMRMYRMTAKGLSELAMGFTGERACVIRIRFVNAFETMAQRLEASEKSITALLHDHDKRSAVSEARARIGSKLMNDRRKEKPALKDEEARLLEIAQPSLLERSDGEVLPH